MIPKYLYQYTDIDSLEKIYTTKKILFKRLDLLNDPYEGLAKDKLGLEIEKARKYIYCSCWTATSPSKTISCTASATSTPEMAPSRFPWGYSATSSPSAKKTSTRP